MPAQNIVHPEASSSLSTGRLAAITLTFAAVAVVVASGAVIALRDDDTNNSAVSVPAGDSSAVYPWELPDILIPPHLFPEEPDPIATSRRQIVVVSSVDDIAGVSSMPGMDMPGIYTEYLVVNDEASESKFLEIQQSLAEPGARPATIIDLR